jgi:drug/metabolite transporter (DMT)-like permease
LLTFLRVALAGATLALLAPRGLWTLLTGPRGRSVAFLGLTFSALPFTLVSVSTGILSASFAAILNSMTPAFTAILGVVWLGRRLGRGQLTGIVVAMLGVLLIVTTSPLSGGGGSWIETIVAVAASLAASASYAVAGTFLGRRLVDAPVVPLAAGQLLTAAAILAVPAAATLPGRFPPGGSLLAVLALALLGTALPWPAFLLVSRWVGAVPASTVTLLVPVFGVLWAALFLQEPLGIGIVPGAAAIAVGLLLVLGLVRPGRRERPSIASHGSGPDAADPRAGRLTPGRLRPRWLHS